MSAANITNVYPRKGSRFDFAFYVHDAGASGDHLVKRVDLSALGAQRKDIPGAIAVDGAFVYSDSTVFLRGSDKANKIKQLGFGLYSNALRGIQENDESGPVWSTHFKPNIEHVEHIIRAAMRRRERLDGKLLQMLPAGRFQPPAISATGRS
jgi:hypothetical protein